MDLDVPGVTIIRHGELPANSYKCNNCGFKNSLTAGTIFQDTKKPLQLWFRAMWYMTNQKYGVNALGLKRALGLGSYRTAWTWMHKLRRAMVRPGRDRMSGVIEVDETYIGGAKEGKRGRGAYGKALVVVAALGGWCSYRSNSTSPYNRCVRAQLGRSHARSDRTSQHNTNGWMEWIQSIEQLGLHP